MVEFDLDIESLVHDPHHLLKTSAARREDYRMMQLVTEIETMFALKHVHSR